MNQLLILRDLECLPQAWHAWNDVQSFERRQAGESRALKRECLLGVWIEPSLLPPPSLKLANSFSLSGVWSLCELEPENNSNDEQFIHRELLMNMLSGDHMPGGSFVPAFEISEPRNSILNQIKKIQSACQSKIFSYLIYDPSAGNYQIEKATL